MKKFGHVRELENITMPAAVVFVISEALTILDSEYGEDRDADRDGGYVLLVEFEDDLAALEEMRIDVNTMIPEYLDRIDCGSANVFVSALILLSDDFGVVIVMPLELLAFTPWELR